MGVDGLRFVITGGAVGIGAGTARLAASRGARVVVSDMNDEPGQALERRLTLPGVTLFIITAMSPMNVRWRA